MVNISGDSKFNNSQIIETVYGDAVLSVTSTPDQLPQIIETIFQIKDEAKYSDEQLESILAQYKAGVERTNIFDQIVKYVGSLKALEDAGKLISTYGPNATTFLKNLLPVICS